MKLSEAKMSSSRFKAALDKSDATIGFEFEMLISPDSDLYRPVKEPAPLRTFNISNLTDIDELLDILGVSRYDKNMVQNSFWKWQDEQAEEWIDQNWSEWDDEDEPNESAARDQAEFYILDQIRKHAVFTFEDYWKTFKTAKEALSEFNIDPAFGWVNDNEVYIDIEEDLETRYDKTWDEVKEIVAKSLLNSPELGISKFGESSNGQWKLTDDGSITDKDGNEYPNIVGYGYELISPPLAASEALESMQKVFDWMSRHKIETNQSTGFHINISMDNLDSLDPVKLILFLGDDYVLNKFDRSTSKYTKSQIQNLFWYVKNSNPAKDLKHENGIYTIAKRVLLSSEKYRSVNFKKLTLENPYLEFRSVGNEDYHRRSEAILDTIGRFLVALNIACDPEAYKQEFLKKLVLLGANNKDEMSDDPLASLITGVVDVYDGAINDLKKWGNEPTLAGLTALNTIIRLAHFEIKHEGKKLRSYHITRLKQLFESIGLTPKTFLDLIASEEYKKYFHPLAPIIDRLQDLKLFPKSA